MRAATFLFGAGVLLAQASQTAHAQPPPPIQVIMDLHMDPLNGFPLSIRPTVYASWRDAADWMMDLCDTYGAKITFLAVGEYMEYTLADTASWPLMERLAAGGSFGTHSHQEQKAGPHNWPNLPGNAPMSAIVDQWNDHVSAVDAVIAAALGISDPNAIRALNNVRGAHLPSSDAARLGLMADFGFTMHQQGPDETFYVYFKHYAMNPYRPSAAHFLSHDPDGPVVVSPFGPVLGRNEVHFGIQQDMRLPAMQTRWLMTLLNWLDDTIVTETGRPWVYGWAEHGADIVPGQVTRDVLPLQLAWLHENFVTHTVSGRSALAWSSAANSRDLYLDWETAHPGQAAFSYPASETDWALYPYLLPVAWYLVDGQYQAAEVAGDVRLHRVTAAASIGGPYDLYVAYPGGNASVTEDLSAVLGVGTIGAVDPRTGLAPLASATSVDVPLTGVLLVPANKRLYLPNGDLNLDGVVDFSDINPFVSVLSGQDPDPDRRRAADINRDGVVDFADVNPFIAALTG
jgi:hypothetical protein